MRIPGVASLLALTLFGCASLSPPGRPSADVDVPTAWSGESRVITGASPVLAQWWLRFNDPLLARLVRESRKSNKSLTGAAAALRQARAERDLAARRFFRC